MTNITEDVHYKDQLEHLIVHDELTGIHNRHYFNDALIDEINRSRRYKTSLAMINFDIDHFKKLNDEFGHDIGDKVLVNITEMVGYKLRETDRFCRIGGEEFCVIMPETDLKQASHIAERIRVAVMETPHSQLPNNVTVSIGVVQLNQWDNEKTLYKRSDIAMYQAKENGRNWVVTLED